MSGFDPASVKALTFDVFGTVVDWRGSIIAEGESYWRAKGIDIDWPAFADAWRGNYGPYMNKVRSAELGWTKLDDLHRMILDDLIVQFGIADKLSKDDVAHLNRVWHRLNAWPDVLPAFAALKPRFILSTLSNGNVALLTKMAKHAGLPWDCILSGELCGHYKPDPQVYEMAWRLLDLEPGEVMMCAAHTNDLDAASKLGMRTAYIHRRDESGPGRERPMPAADAYDVVVDDYTDLAKALLT